MEGNTDQRRCARCGQEKPLGDFGKKQRRPNEYQSYCRPCQSEYHREHYQKNKKEYLSSVHRRYTRLQEILRAAKDKPCADCGIKFPYYVMDLDHREGEDKLGTFGQMLRKHSLRALRAEIAKCEVVCSNCHRERTYQRKEHCPKRYRKIAAAELSADALL